MTQLDEIVSTPKVVVIRSVRKDHAMVTATRVPFGDIRLEEWGWILSVSYKNNHAQDGLEELSDRDGQHYPKLYSLDDLKGCADLWQCIEWEDVYQKQNEADPSLQNTTVLAPSLPGENELLKEAMVETQTYIVEQLTLLRQDIDERLQSHMQILTAQAEANAQRTLSFTTITEALSEKTEVLSKQTDIFSKRTEDLETNMVPLTTKTIYFTEQTEILTTRANEITTKLDETQEKIAMNQIRLGNGYYKNVNTQSKQSFDLARFLIIIGAGIFVVSMIAFIIPFSTGNTTLVGSIGIIASCIVEVIGGLSFLYNKASVQFAHFHLFLDRINRASIAHAMCDSIKDENRRQEQLITIVQELLKDDEKIKG